MSLCGCQDDEAGNVLSSLMGVVSLMCCCYTSLFLGSAAACCLFLLLLSNPATLVLPCPAATLHNLLLFMACWASLHCGYIYNIYNLPCSHLIISHIGTTLQQQGITLLSGPAAGYTIHHTTQRLSHFSLHSYAH